MARAGGVKMPGSETTLNDRDKTRHLLLDRADFAMSCYVALQTVSSWCWLNIPSYHAPPAGHKMQSKKKTDEARLTIFEWHLTSL